DALHLAFQVGASLLRKLQHIAANDEVATARHLLERPRAAGQRRLAGAAHHGDACAADGHEPEIAPRPLEGALAFALLLQILQVLLHDPRAGHFAGVDRSLIRIDIDLAGNGSDYGYF